MLNRITREPDNREQGRPLSDFRPDIQAIGVPLHVGQPHAGAETHLYRIYENNGNEMLEEALRIAAEVTCQMGERLGAKGSSVGFVGGVLSNESIRNYLKQYLSRELGFPKPAYNSDNAVGVARGTWRSWKEGMT